MQIPEDEDLSVGLAVNKKPSQMAMLKDYCGILAAADNPTPAGKAASFISLNGSKVQVEFEIIGSRLRRRILEAVTRERHGEDGVRIISLLLTTGKMDEKQVRAVARHIWSPVAHSFVTDIENWHDGPERRPAIVVCHGR